MDGRSIVVVMAVGVVIKKVDEERGAVEGSVEEDVAIRSCFPY